MPRKPVFYSTISSGYGKRTIAEKESFHHGIDIVSNAVKPIVQAAYSGTIVKLGWSDSFGYRVWVKTNDFHAVYAHLEKINELLKEGAQIYEGDMVGIMGNTGTILYKGKLVINKPNKNGELEIQPTHGKHLHFELRKQPVVGSTSIRPVEIENLYKE